MTKIKIIDQCHTEITRVSDPNEQYDNDDTYTSHNIEGIEKSKSFYDLEVPFNLKPGTPYYLVSVYYNTGDSFHRSENEVDHIDLFATYEKAKELQKIVQEDLKNDDFKGIEYKTESAAEMKIHANWKGYFENCQHCDVKTVFLS